MALSDTPSPADLRDKDGLTIAEFLTQYREKEERQPYPSPSVTVDPVIFTVTDNEPDDYKRLPAKELRVLLIKRGGHPYLGQWALPGGFVNLHEDLHDAAKRELYEETNIAAIQFEQLCTFGNVTRFDPDKGDPTPRDPRKRVLSVGYLSLIDARKVNLQAGDDADDAKWFTVTDDLISEHRTTNPAGYSLDQRYRLTLCSGDLLLGAVIRKQTTITGTVAEERYSLWANDRVAFDHAAFIYYGLVRLRNRLSYTPIVFNLMPELFTLTELRKVFEFIQKRVIADALFRRQLKHRLVQTNEQRAGGGHAKATLYRFDPLLWEQTS